VGNVSTTVIVPEAGAVPVLLTAIVYVPVCPIVKLPVCVLITASTGRTIVVGSLAVGALLAPPPDALALFVRGDVAFAATLTVTVMAVPLALAAIADVLVQVAVWPLPLHVQPVPLAALYVKPAGSVSVTVIVPEVGPVPVLLTAMVYVPVWPATKFPVCDLAIASAGPTIVVGSVAVGALLAPPPDALALFVSGEVAFAATLTVRLIGFPLALAAIADVLVHVAA
jgi:hypothetical protein